MTYDSEAGVARVITSSTSKKARNIIEGGPGARAAVSQADGARWATLEGIAVINDDPAAVADAVERYTKRYHSPRANPKRVVIEITVTTTMGNVKPR